VTGQNGKDKMVRTK